MSNIYRQEGISFKNHQAQNIVIYYLVSSNVYLICKSMELNLPYDIYGSMPVYNIYVLSIIMIVMNV